MSLAFARSLACALFVCAAGSAATINQNFNNVSALFSSGWTAVNASSPVGATSWFQGNPGVFPAESGPDDSYLAANFLATGSGGQISLWLISPLVYLNNGDTIGFQARNSDPGFLDRVERRSSQGGGSSLAGFSSLLTTANLTTTWTGYSANVSGLGGQTVGRIALRYVAAELDASYIGIDTLRTSVAPVPEPSAFAMGIVAIAALAAWKGRGR